LDFNSKLQALARTLPFSGRSNLSRAHSLMAKRKKESREKEEVGEERRWMGRSS
jgi:hypothetical protein